MIDLAEKCHAEIVALNERNRARVSAIMARCQTELDRAREDHLAELTEIEFNARIAMDKRLEGFRGPGSDPAKDAPVEEAKPAIAINAPKPLPRAVDMLDAEPLHKPLPRILERPARDAAS